MATTEVLGVYLSDHHAGSAGGVELAEKLHARHEGTPFGTVLAALVRDIKQDQATLEDLMGRLEVEQSTVKQAVGWGLEKLSRLKFNRQLTGSSELTRLLETETLSLGIEGKLLLWQALKAIAEVEPRLATVDFDRLVGRARQQRERLEPFRLEAAAKAVSS